MPLVPALKEAEAEAELCEFKAILVYRVSSVRVAQRKPVLKKKKKIPDSHVTTHSTKG